MRSVFRACCVAFAAFGILLAGDRTADAQYPVVVAPVVPTAVGYVPERRGFFGRRIVYRPVVTAVAPALPVTSTVVAARPVVVARPVLVSPTVTMNYAPTAAVAPVQAYYPPAAPVTVPVIQYRVPVPTYLPAVGY